MGQHFRCVANEAWIVAAAGGERKEADQHACRNGAAAELTKAEVTGSMVFSVAARRLDVRHGGGGSPGGIPSP